MKDKNNLRKIIVRFIFAIALVCAIGLACSKVKRLFINKTDGIKTIASFYTQEKNSLDIVFVGSSRVFCDINPASIWKDRGVASFDIATGAQPILESELIVKEIFKTQKPKVIAVEVSQLDENRDFDVLQMESVALGLKPSLDKYKLIMKKAPSDMKKDFFFGPALYHGRYSELDREDQNFWLYTEYRNSAKAGYKGYFDYWHKVEFEEYGDPVVDNVEVNDVTLSALENMRQMCIKNDCQFVMLYSPDIYLHDYTRFHEYAEEHDVKYINGNLCINEMGLSSKEDFIDEGHLNIYGAEKWSRYIMNQLCEDVLFDSHAGDLRYASFDDNVYYLESVDRVNGLVNATGLGDYFAYFPNPDYVMIVSLVGDYDSVFAGQKDLLASKCGINEETYYKGGTWVFYNSQCLYYSDDSEELEFHMDMNGHVIEVSGEKNAPEVYVDGREEGVVYEGHKLENGIQIVVFDTLQNRVIDAMDYNTDRDFAWERTTEE